MKLYNVIFFIFCFFSLSSQKQLEKLPSNINSNEYDEIGPVLNEENTILYFTRIGDPEFVNVISENLLDEKQNLVDRLKTIFSQISGKTIENPQTSSFNQDIFYSNIIDNNFQNIIHPGYPLNSAHPNSVFATIPEENSLVVINQFDNDGGIQKGFSKVKIHADGSFGFPAPMVVHDFDNSGNEISMSLSCDAEQLFIAMDRPDSKGETDIYLSIRVGENTWSKPTPLNSPINSIYKETAPFLSRDKNRLYFASNRPGSQGGLDIYVAEKLDFSYKNWSEPKLLPIPINSGSDDTQPFLDKNEDYLYFTSKRDGGSDIYRFHLTASNNLKQELSISINIIDEETNSITGGEIFWGLAYEMGYEGFFRTNTGEYEITLSLNELVKFKAFKRGYTGEEIIIDPLELIKDNITKYHLDLYVKNGPQSINNTKELPYPFGKQRKITLRNIYFERSESTVLPESFPELEKLIQVLKELENLHILIEGHSDNIGEKVLLQQLSEQRAIAIKQYLVDNGINPERIETVGLGDKYPLNDNLTESDRQRNRRVEIRVIAE